MLELKDEMSLFIKVKPEVAVKYMKSKTENIFLSLWISLWKTFNSKNDDSSNLYVPIFLDCVTSVPKLEGCLSQETNNPRRGISESIPASIEQQEQEKAKFYKGMYDLNNNLLVNKLKIMYNFLPIDVGEFVENYIHES